LFLIVRTKFKWEETEKKKRKRKSSRRQTITVTTKRAIPRGKGFRGASNTIAEAGVLPSEDGSRAARKAQSSLMHVPTTFFL